MFCVLLLCSLQVINQEKWERDVRSASSLDELLMLTDFPDWKLWKCRLKLKHLETSPSSSSSQQPNHRSSSSSAGSHRSTRYAAASYSLEILKGMWVQNLGLLKTVLAL